MTIQTAPTAAGGRKEARSPFIIAVCGAALVLAAAAGVGTWQAVRHSDADTVGVTSQQQGSTAAIEPGRAFGGAAVAARPFRSMPADQSLTFYIVGSQEQADFVRSALDNGNAIRLQAGESLLTDEVVVVGSPDAEARILRGIADGDAIRGSAGLPEIKVVDLRTP